MHRNLRFATVILAGFACAIASASTQAAQQGAARNPGLVTAPSAPPVAVTPSTGINTSGHNQPGVPNTSTPGIIGTGAQPSGMRGDSRAAPGFPATGQR